MKRTLNISKSFALVALLISSFFFFSNFTSSSSRISDVSENGRSPLVQYGEYVFQRENCLECHTLRDENETVKRSSLDGYGDRRSAYWIYTLFMRPSSIGYRNHPKFQLLTKKKVNKSELQKIYEKNEIRSESEKDLARIELEHQLDSITSYIIEKQEVSNDLPTIPERTEMVALIAFLQQIPSTPERAEQERLWEEWRKEEDRKWNEFIASSDSIISIEIDDPNSIASGGELFQRYCTTCHGTKAEGWIGPNLTDNYWIYGNSLEDLARLLGDGSETGKMPEHKSKLNQSEICDIVSYLKSIEGTNVDGAEPQGTLR